MLVFHKAATFLRDGGAFTGADAEDLQAFALLAQGLDDAVLLLLIEAAADQQDLALTLGALLEQGQGLTYAQVGTLSGGRHDRWVEGFQQVAGGGQVVRQRHQGVGAAGKHDNAGGCVTAAVQQVEQFALGLLQTIGGDIAGEHGRT